MHGARELAMAVIGVSAGGFEALQMLLGALPANFTLPLVIVQHLRPGNGGTLAQTLDRRCILTVKEAEDGESIRSGTVYVAPADYHLLVERDATFALSVDPHVRYARPSIDVLFESAAEAFGARIIGIILTGANDDGSAGLRAIRQNGGVTIVQDPDDAAISQMPLSAIKSVTPDYIVTLERLPDLLCQLSGCALPVHHKEMP